MEEEKKLYPFKLIPVEETPDETWQLADMGFPDSMVRNGFLSTNTLSEIMEMYMDRVVGEGVYAAYGRQFPVLMKTLKGENRTSLMVHPDDEIAAQRFDFLGKAKLWYVVSARKGARLYLGFARDVTASEFYQACRDGSVESLLNVVEPQAGDAFFIAPGTVHAAGEGLVIAEIAESSPLDFRIYDWGRVQGEIDPFDAELTLEAAFDFIDFSAWKGSGPRPVVDSGPVRLTDNPEFIASEIRLKEPLHVRCEEFGSFVAYLCVRGEADVQVRAQGQVDHYTFGAGESLLVPVEVPEFYLVPCSADTLLLEAVVDRPEPEAGLLDFEVDNSAD